MCIMKYRTEEIDKEFKLKFSKMNNFIIETDTQKMEKNNNN